MMHINAQITVQILKEDDCFVAYCPELELSSHGETISEAKKNFQEVLHIFIEDVVKRGTLEQVLEECGWIRVEDNIHNWVPPAVIARETYPLDISY